MPLWCAPCFRPLHNDDVVVNLGDSPSGRTHSPHAHHPHHSPSSLLSMLGVDDRLILDQESLFRRRWDTFMFLCVVAVGVIIPLRIGFHLYDYKAWLPVDILTDFLFFFDTLVNLSTSYELDGELVKSRVSIFKNYLRGWFLPDVLSFLPFECFCLVYGWYSPVFRVNRLVRLMRLTFYFSQWEKSTALKPTLIRIFKSSFSILFLAHFNACGYFLVVTMEGDRATKDFMGTLDLVHLPLRSRYLRSFYWAFVTMTGYNNANPHTEAETFFSIYVTMVGIALFATIIGTVGSLVTNFDSSATFFREKLDSVSDYMKYKRIPPELQKEVRNYYRYLWKSGKGLDRNKVLDDLPPYLLNKMNVLLNREIIKKVPLFQHCKDDVDFINELVKCLRPRVVLPNTIVVRKGEVGDEMYFISCGELNVVADDDKVVFTLRDGGFFGEIALLYDTKRTATIVARTYCDMFVLTKDDFRKVIARFPLQSQGIQQIAKERFQAIVDAQKQQEDEKLKQHQEATKVDGSPSDQLSDKNKTNNNILNDPNQNPGEMTMTTKIGSGETMVEGGPGGGGGGGQLDLPGDPVLSQYTADQRELMDNLMGNQSQGSVASLDRKFSGQGLMSFQRFGTSAGASGGAPLAAAVAQQAAAGATTTNSPEDGGGLSGTTQTGSGGSIAVGGPTCAGGGGGGPRRFSGTGNTNTTTTATGASSNGLDSPASSRQTLLHSHHQQQQTASSSERDAIAALSPNSADEADPMIVVKSPTSVAGERPILPLSAAHLRIFRDHEKVGHNSTSDVTGTSMSSLDGLDSPSHAGLLAKQHPPPQQQPSTAPGRGGGGGGGVAGGVDTPQSLGSNHSPASTDLEEASNSRQKLLLQKDEGDVDRGGGNGARKRSGTTGAGTGGPKSSPGGAPPNTTSSASPPRRRSSAADVATTQHQHHHLPLGSSSSNSTLPVASGGVTTNKGLFVPVSLPPPPSSTVGGGEGSSKPGAGTTTIIKKRAGSTAKPSPPSANSPSSANKTDDFTDLFGNG